MKPFLLSTFRFPLCRPGPVVSWSRSPFPPDPISAFCFLLSVLVLGCFLLSTFALPEVGI